MAISVDNEGTKEGGWKGRRVIICYTVVNLSHTQDLSGELLLPFPCGNVDTLLFIVEWLCIELLCSVDREPLGSSDRDSGLGGLICE